MRIACPACNAVYQVPDEQLREGRVVRCVRCGTDWAPVVATEAEVGAEVGAEVAPEVVPVIDDVPEPVPEPRVEPVVAPVVEPAVAPAMALEAEPPVEAVAMPPVRATERPTRRVPVLAIAWIASVAAVLAAVVLLYVGRERVMAAWPPSVRLYAAVGLARH